LRFADWDGNTTLQDVMGQKVRVIAEAAIKTQPKKKKSGFFSM
jgi:hypothetical protein